MKIKFLTAITSLLAAAFMITSCLDDNEEQIEYSSNASITAFSIENIETQYIDSTHYGKDTTITATVIGKNYPFVIDQGQRLIYNVDSLPVGTNVSKVVVNITADTPWIVIATEDKDTVWTATDSLNFEKPVKFKVVAYSGEYGPTYTAKINVHKQVPDSLQWTYLGADFDNNIQGQKAVTLDNKIYVFGLKNNEVVLTTTNIDNGKSWSTSQSLLLPNADYSSVMAWKKALYMLANNELYSSINGIDWEKVAVADESIKFSKLIANVYAAEDKKEPKPKLYAIDTDKHFIESEDGINWTISPNNVPDNFPDKYISYASYPLETNTEIYRTTLLGGNSNASVQDTTTVVWTKLTTEKNWGDYPTSEGDKHYCPKLDKIAMVHYNDRLYVFGGPGESYGKKIPAFSRFYQSKDQGITWDPVSQYVLFPEEFTALYDQANGNYSFVVDKNNFLWIIWSQSGKVWKGRVNKMGFDIYK